MSGLPYMISGLAERRSLHSGHELRISTASRGVSALSDDFDMKFDTASVDLRSTSLVASTTRFGSITAIASEELSTTRLVARVTDSRVLFFSSAVLSANDSAIKSIVLLKSSIAVDRPRRPIVTSTAVCTCSSPNNVAAVDSRTTETTRLCILPPYDLRSLLNKPNIHTVQNAHNPIM